MYLIIINVKKIGKGFHIANKKTNPIYFIDSYMM